ncbi:MAG: hypothetical protein GX336_03830 [Halanaerobiaceae bacterium]|nr:hypothetical protein [Halanaerobiaceae bacterium]
MFKRFMGIFLMGLVIKIMDDFIDKEIDEFKGQWNITSIFKRAILPYSLVLTIISLFLNFSEAVSGFAASYLLGMSSGLNERLPSGLKAWQEGLIFLLLSIYMSSVGDSLAALLIISTIQLIDDFLDLKKDTYIDSRNLIIKLGKFNSLLLTIAFFLLSIKYFPLKCFYYYSAVFLLYLLLYLGENLYRKDRCAN